MMVGHHYLSFATGPGGQGGKLPPINSEVNGLGARPTPGKNTEKTQKHRQTQKTQIKKTNSRTQKQKTKTTTTNKNNNKTQKL
jgi:hypothetical protein